MAISCQTPSRSLPMSCLQIVNYKQVLQGFDQPS